MDITGTEKLIFSLLLLLPVIAASGTYEYTCGNFTSESISYFVNPIDTPSFCFFEVNVKHSRVTQLRLDFERFTLEQPTVSGYNPITNDFPPYLCNEDTFKVSSPSIGASVRLGFQNLCGENSGQHIYIPVNASEDYTSVQLLFSLADRAQGKLIKPYWRIKITQIDCGSPDTKDLCAPEGCLQYYPDRAGEFESFNYNSGAGHYQGYLNYAICFKRYDGICSIQYTPSGFQLAADNFATPYGTAGCNVATTDPSNPNSKDYLFIPDGQVESRVTESLFCGNYLNAYTVETNAPGPIYAFFKTDGIAEEVVLGSEIGFRIQYSESGSGC